MDGWCLGGRACRSLCCNRPASLHVLPPPPPRPRAAAAVPVRPPARSHASGAASSHHPRAAPAPSSGPRGAVCQPEAAVREGQGRLPELLVEVLRLERVLRRLRGRRDRHVVLVCAAPRCGLGRGGGEGRCVWMGRSRPGDCTAGGGAGWPGTGRWWAWVAAVERGPALGRRREPRRPPLQRCATPSGARTGAGGTPAGGRGSRYGAASVPLAGGWCQQAPSAHPGPRVGSLQPQPRPCSAPLRPTCSAPCPPLLPTPPPDPSRRTSRRTSQYPKARTAPRARHRRRRVEGGA
jgi:hypothetical protein